MLDQVDSATGKTGGKSASAKNSDKLLPGMPTKNVRQMNKKNAKFWS